MLLFVQALPRYIFPLVLLFVKDSKTENIFCEGGAHDSTWIDGSSELFTFPKLCSILIANIASLALPELVYE